MKTKRGGGMIRIFTRAYHADPQGGGFGVGHKSFVAHVPGELYEMLTHTGKYKIPQK